MTPDILIWTLAGLLGLGFSLMLLGMGMLIFASGAKAIRQMLRGEWRDIV